MRLRCLWILVVALLACNGKREEMTHVAGAGASADLATNDPKARTLPEPLAAVLRDASNMQLLSLYWVPLDDPQLPVDLRGRERMDGYPIVGATDVSDQKDAIVAAIAKGVANNIGDAASCFEPRHALRAMTADGRAAELVICFECLQIAARVQGREYDLYTAGHAEPLMEKLLRRGNIPPYTPPAGG